jgi:excisionase family DNA binding protein
VEQKLFLSVNEVIKVTGLGRTNIYALINKGELKAVKIGDRTMFRPADLAEFAASRPVYAA